VRQQDSINCPGLHCSSTGPRSTQFSPFITGYLHRCRLCDANACAQDGLPILCGSQTAAFYPTVCANDLVPDSYRLAGTAEAGLRKCRFGRSSGLYLLRRLQSVINATARLIFGLRGTDHIFVSFYLPSASENISLPGLVS